MWAISLSHTHASMSMTPGRKTFGSKSHQQQNSNSAAGQLPCKQKHVSISKVYSSNCITAKSSHIFAAVGFPGHPVVIYTASCILFYEQSRTVPCRCVVCPVVTCQKICIHHCDRKPTKQADQLQIQGSSTIHGELACCHSKWRHMPSMPAIFSTALPVDSLPYE